MTENEPRADDEGWSDSVLVWNGLVASVPALVVPPASARELGAAVDERCVPLDLSLARDVRGGEPHD